MQKGLFSSAIGFLLLNWSGLFGLMFLGATYFTPVNNAKELLGGFFGILSLPVMAFVVGMITRKISRDKFRWTLLPLVVMIFLFFYELTLVKWGDSGAAAGPFFILVFTLFFVYVRIGYWGWSVQKKKETSAATSLPNPSSSKSPI